MQALLASMPAFSVPLLVPLLLLLGALATLLPLAMASRWRIAQTAGSLALAAGLLSPLAPDPAMTTAGLVVLMLVAFLGWVILRFSRPYLTGEPCQQRFLPALLFMLAAAGLVTISDHLGVLAAAWSATSLGLQRLLTLYPDRPGALLAAHKHFVANRLADIALVTAVVLIGRETGTLSLNALSRQVPAMDGTPGLYLAATLLALAAAIRCAQLPLHGWLVQVMEAPTPVSALLHAGVVNLGGLVLIKVAWLVQLSGAAQWLLLVSGGLTVLVASLTMIAQTSIKVRLAWSTSAQMGFMLMECALGAWHLALLHLVGHSLYKAHAFLNAGERVRRTRRTLLHPRQQGPVRRAALVPPLLLAAALPLLHAFDRIGDSATVLLLVTLVAVVPLLGGTGVPGRRAGARPWLAAAALIGLYLFWHESLAWMTGGAPVLPLDSARVIWVSGLFAALLLLQTRILGQADSRGIWRARFAAGLQLDEAFTRLSLKLWPRLPAASGPQQSIAPWQREESSA